MKSYISTVAFPNTGGIIVSNYTQWRNSIPKGFRNMRSAFFKKSKAGKFVNPNLMFTQISQITQILYLQRKSGGRNYASQESSLCKSESSLPQ